MKHNNVVPNAHFHKYWQRYVKTWFDQPAKKSARRVRRAAKAARVAPRPINLLRPAVRAQTFKYGAKLRAGRGFTLEELKAAGFARKEARGLGVAVDYRRTNRSEESFVLNVERLKTYKAQLVVFPRRPNSQKTKAGDSTADELARAKQVLNKMVLPLPPRESVLEAPRVLSAAEREFEAYTTLRKERMDAKVWGLREKKARDAKEAEMNK